MEQLLDNAHLMVDLVSDNNRALSIAEEQNRIMQYTIAAKHKLSFFRDALPEEVKSYADVREPIDAKMTFGLRG